MPKVEIYTNRGCPSCVNAKQYLDRKGVQYEEKKLGKSKSTDVEFKLRSRGAKTVPQIFIDGEHIGGFDDLLKYDSANELDWRLGLEERPNTNILQKILRTLRGEKY